MRVDLNTPSRVYNNNDNNYNNNNSPTVMRLRDGRGGRGGSARAPPVFGPDACNNVRRDVIPYVSYTGTVARYHRRSAGPS